ncbi:hypothetical protein [Herpetosiphon geysericola]|uniref:Uncharacterized protein n=1 Tax=Herpetosiphon geysericola TaxID=70996 RepID=A0A0P6YL69_9CHLR|nr:hypothetical protein [Herpetosiphon geysericola]KPL83349.1 hypothetical protein SE18_19245 [Herpetosiphon geysericola]
MRFQHWIIVSLLVVFASSLGAYIWLNQPEPRPSPPAGWQTIEQADLIISLPPEYIVLNPTLANANQEFTETYSGTYKTLVKIATDPVKIDFLAVNPKNGDTIAIVDKAYSKNYLSVFDQFEHVADLMIDVRKHNQQPVDLYSASDRSRKYHKEIIFQVFSEELQFPQSEPIFELIGQNIVLLDN